MAPKILTRFVDDLQAVQLQPIETPGKYSIFVNDTIIFDRKEAGSFIEIMALKQLVRDYVNPNKTLGHIDKKI